MGEANGAHKIGIIGFGKIAQDQHLPNIKANPDFELVAVSSQRGLKPDEAKHAFTDYREMLKRCRTSRRSPSARRRRCATRSPARRFSRARACSWKSRPPPP